MVVREVAAMRLNHDLIAFQGGENDGIWNDMMAQHAVFAKNAARAGRNKVKMYRIMTACCNKTMLYSMREIGIFFCQRRNQK